jgi:AAA+ ATPase superfamily predicted ATPase
MEKPFVFGVATSGDNFTDREKETQRLLLNFAHGVNTVLISPRRWGKTSLVKKVAQLSQDIRGEKRCVSKFGRSENI